MKLCILIYITYSITSSADATILSVPNEYLTIQAAIDAATDGDIVEIQNGTYSGDGNFNLDFHGKAITVCSESHNPELCIIDCEENGRGFYFHSGEDLKSILKGITITNGLANAETPGGAQGGGLLCSDASPTLDNCRFVQNTVCQFNLIENHGRGGGVLIGANSNPSISNCEFLENHACGNGGGLFNGSSSNREITNCLFMHNTIEFEASQKNQRYGAGMYNQGDVILIDCAFIENLSEEYAGGLCNESCNPTLKNCIFKDNTAYFQGGGMFNIYSNPTLTHCILRGNISSGHGGGIFNRSSFPTLIHCVLTGNVARSTGGGFYYEPHYSSSKYGIFTGNDSSYPDGKTSVSTSSDASITNCILRENYPDEIGFENVAPVVTYSNIQNAPDLEWLGENCIDANPLFAFPDDFHLLPDSPCIDAGTNAPPGGLAGFDPDGIQYPQDGNLDSIPIADMGVYEFEPTQPRFAVFPESIQFNAAVGGRNPAPQTLFVRNIGCGSLQWEVTRKPAWLAISCNQELTGGRPQQIQLEADIDGLDCDRYAGILELTASALNSPVRIPVTLVIGRSLTVPGEYSTIQEAIDAAEKGDFVEIEDGTFTGAGNTNLEFHGKAITVRGASGDPESCIIDCENNGGGFILRSKEQIESVVEALTITRASSFGLSCWCSNPTITNCIFRNNGSSKSVEFVNCTGPTIAQCRFVNNVSQLDAPLSITSSNPVISDCLFLNNSTHRSDGFAWGGAIYCHGVSRPVLSGCVFNNNSSDRAGAICNGSYIPIFLNNCLFIDNDAEEGGAIYNGWGTSFLSNCSFINNTALSGACVYNSHSQLLIANSILHGEEPDNLINDDPDTIVSVSYSGIPGGTSMPWFGPGCIDSDPMFVGINNHDGNPETHIDYRLAPGSPCIDAGKNAAIPIINQRICFYDSPVFDALDIPDTGAGTAPIVDMGAYERLPEDGDYGCDGDVDLRDFAMFQACFRTSDPFCIMAFDFNGDSAINLEDFPPFNDLLAGPLNTTPTGF